MDRATLSRHALARMTKSPRFPPDAPRFVEVLAFPEVQLLDVAGPLQVFATANEHGGLGQPYAPRVIAAGEPHLTASAGLRLIAHVDRQIQVAGTSRGTECKRRTDTLPLSGRCQRTFPFLVAPSSIASPIQVSL